MELLNRRFNSTFIRCLVVAVLVVSLLWTGVPIMSMEQVVVYAAVETEVAETKIENFDENTGETVEPLTEQTEWVFRVHNGRLQRRLWSITWGRWLTDWEYIT